MIARMSKVAIIGPKNLGREVLAVLQDLGMLHLEQEHPAALGAAGSGPPLSPPPPSPETTAERLFCEQLRQRLDEVLACLSPAPERRLSLDPAAAVGSVETVLARHLASCQQWRQELASLAQRIKELDLAVAILTAVAPLFSHDQDGEGGGTDGQEYLAILVRNPGALSQLQQHLAGRQEEVRALTAPLADGRTAGLLIASPAAAGQVKSGLAKAGVPPLPLPAGLSRLPPADQLLAVQRLLREAQAGRQRLAERLEALSRRWRPVYQLVHRWLGQRLRLLQATASLYETAMCFVLFGWLPRRQLAPLATALERRFGGRVVVEEQELLEQDLDRVPVMLDNPPYFRPFEIFARLLPTPAYSSFDLTPFIGIFFPLFFGMMLGDMGYGLVLMLLALAGVGWGRRHRYLQDVAKILFVCGVYTMLFGWLYGECFGTAGARLLGLHARLDRHDSIVPMLLFALAVGVVHVAIGLALGAVAAIHRKRFREAAFKGLTILFLVSLGLALAAYAHEPFTRLQRPLLISVGVLVPVLLVTGGLMAPLEVLKTVGSIVSYARIMAIGLTSVLLAYVANSLAGAMGSVWVGALVAVLLHGLNTVLGVFAPVIHSLRLHYVEFLSKFMEPGGRKYAPLKKNQES